MKPRKVKEKNPRNCCQKIADKTICSVKNAYYYFVDSIRLRRGRRNWKPESSPLVSIIIPTRNRLDILRRRAVASVLKQTYANWELIIVDESSNGNMVWFGNKRVKVWNLKKKFHYPKNAWCVWCAGPVRALNFALSKVKGDYILRMNDHDILYPSAVEHLVSYMKSTVAELASAQHLGNGEPVEPYIIRGKKIGGIQVSLLRSYLKCFRYNKDCWRKKWNSPNELDLIDRMLRSNVRTAYLPQVLGEIKPRLNGNLVGWKQIQKDYKDLL